MTLAAKTRTQVGIIGAGPSGLLLARLLHQRNIDVVVLERRSREYVESRIRAGVLETGTAALLEKAGAAQRMRAGGLIHEGIQIAFDGRLARVDLQKHAAAPVIVYGQTEITKDLNSLNLADGIEIRFESEVKKVMNADSKSPALAFESHGDRIEIRCEFVAGCDGYHGVSRRSIPANVQRVYEKTYPFGWLGVLSDTRPASGELIYSNHERGFALCSQRSTSVSRNYIQVSADDNVDRWSDDDFWDELRRRLPREIADSLDTGPSMEKSIAPLRSFIAEPMRFGRLFLVGDAGHIVPPTGAKGLNLAASDAGMLASALEAHYESGDDTGIDRYSTTALARVWQAERFSWWFTMATHRLSDDPFDRRLQAADLDYFTGTAAGLRSISENYVGLPIRDPVTGNELV
jgi:p-hydroxybenzoate 3-monooxygenase